MSSPEGWYAARYYHVGEGYPEVNHPPIPLGTPHKLLMGVVPGVRPLNHPPQTGRERGSLALLGDHPHQAPLLMKPTGELRVVGTIQMHARSIRQLRKWLQRVEGRLQEWRVVTVGRSDDTPQRDASRVHHTRAFDSSFSPVHRASSCFPLPRGALVMHPSTARSAISRPMRRS